MSLPTPQNDDDTTTDMVQHLSFRSEVDMLQYFAKEMARIDPFLYRYNTVNWSGQYSTSKTTMGGFVRRFEAQADQSKTSGLQTNSG